MDDNSQSSRDWALSFHFGAGACWSNNTDCCPQFTRHQVAAGLDALCLLVDARELGEWRPLGVLHRPSDEVLVLVEEHKAKFVRVEGVGPAWRETGWHLLTSNLNAAMQLAVWSVRQVVDVCRLLAIKPWTTGFDHLACIFDLSEDVRHDPGGLDVLVDCLWHEPNRNPPLEDCRRNRRVDARLVIGAVKVIV